MVGCFINKCAAAEVLQLNSTCPDAPSSVVRCVTRSQAESKEKKYGIKNTIFQLTRTMCTLRGKRGEAGLFPGYFFSLTYETWYEIRAAVGVLKQIVF